MTNKELNKVLEGIKYVPNENERDEITQIILKAANDSITLKKLKKMTATVGKGEASDLEQFGSRGFINFLFVYIILLFLFSLSFFIFRVCYPHF